MKSNEIKILFFDDKIAKWVNHILRITDEDFWTSFNYQNQVYDIHYCEEYGTISIYRVLDNNTDYDPIYTVDIKDTVEDNIRKILQKSFYKYGEGIEVATKELKELIKKE